MPAASVEKTITNRLERLLIRPPARLVESKSVPGVSLVKVFFRDDVDSNYALTLTNSLALGTLPTLPPNTLPPVVLPFDPTGTMPIGILTVSNPRVDESHVKDIARIDVRNMLGAVPGSVNPVVVGGKDRTVLVYLDPQKLEARQLSPVDVVNALQQGNLMVTPGTAYFGDNQVLLDTNVMVRDVDELNDLPIRIVPGNNVYLRDIGHAEDSYAIQTSRVRVNGHRQVYVPIYRQGGASTLAVAEGVKKLPEMEQRLPRRNEAQLRHGPVPLCPGSDQEPHRRGHNWGGAGLDHDPGVPRQLADTLIASMSIPLAILAAITGLYATGNTINAMTLGGPPWP